MDAKPLLSIIVANPNGQPEIVSCLAALEKQMADDRVEVIVVESADAAIAEA